MTKNNQVQPKAKLRLEELKEEGKVLAECEMKQVTGGAGPNRTNVIAPPNLNRIQSGNGAGSSVLQSGKGFSM
ncbi:hypothetical protein JCM10914A_05430 [Paenibacillus sp. JCM 10914]|uniref:hypothetical protein n=1 Tax=Paenibacillus sp. JCM 10914 TaxID=1236974 RepID=UPI0003CCA70D|nr:hypothetical protein [Paenibacillus sp. JCM 10914]GAE07028.1 hypothetical protein JCM10914_3232 [Paenibacillus sp. JCM 10914]